MRMSSPLHGERTGVFEVVERNDDVLELDVAVSQRTEVPEAAGIAEICAAAEDADRAVAVAPPRIFHVDVIDAGAEGRG